MSTLLDHRVALGREETYGAMNTPHRFYPWLDGTQAHWDLRPRQGEGVRGGTGRRAALGARRFLPQGQGEVTIKAELESRGLGVLLDWALGISTVTDVPGGSQQVFHPGITGTHLPSATIQLVTVDNTGTERPQTYSGCTPSKIVIEQGEDEIPTVEITADALDRTETVPAAAAHYPTNTVLFDATAATVALGGALAPPTDTAPSTGPPPVGGWRSWKLELDQSLDTGRWVLGGRARPTAGTPKITFSGEVEYNDTTWQTALVTGTQLPWSCTWGAPDAVGTGNALLQVVLPQLSLTKGLPTPPADGKTVVAKVEADVTSPGTGQDLWVVYRTTDTAL